MNAEPPNRVVHLPNPVWLHTAASFFHQAEFPWPNDGEAMLSLPNGYCYLSPLAIAAVSAWGDTLRARGVTIRCENVNTQGVGYASRLHMFEHIGCQGPPVAEHEETGRFIPVTRIESQEQLRDFSVNVVPLLHIDSPETGHAVRYCLEELIRNVLEHSNGASAFACAQYYPTSNKVSVAVADCGQGLYKSLAANHPDLTNDQGAALLALRPGVSGVTATKFGAAENAGAGLFFTKTIAKFSGERFLLYSGTGGYLLLRHQDASQRALVFDDASSDKHKPLIGAPWPGALAALDIGVSPDYDFKDVLKVIRDRYFDFTKGKTRRRPIRFEGRVRR